MADAEVDPATEPLPVERLRLRLRLSKLLLDCRNIDRRDPRSLRLFISIFAWSSVYLRLASSQACWSPFLGRVPPPLYSLAAKMPPTSFSRLAGDIVVIGVSICKNVSPVDVSMADNLFLCLLLVLED